LAQATAGGQGSGIGRALRSPPSPEIFKFSSLFIAVHRWLNFDFLTLTDQPTLTIFPFLQPAPDSKNKNIGQR